MRKKHLLLTAILLLLTAVLPACWGGGSKLEPLPNPSPAYRDMSRRVSGIAPSSPSSLAALLGAAQQIEKAVTQGTVSVAEAGRLESELGAQFNSWTRAAVDRIDPSEPGALKDFFDLQAVQRTVEYDRYVNPATKRYEEEQMADKFNQWVRHRVDEIDPADPGALKDMFDLQVVQRTAKYDELATAETKQYKEEQMGQKLNDWVRHRVDEIDPADPDNLKYFFWMQTVQASEKYNKFATPETHEYKERQMKQKFTEWVEGRVNDLDPGAPDFLEQLDMLRAIQRSEKYARFTTLLMHRWKEETLAQKMDDHVRKRVDALDPLLPTFWKDLWELTRFQLSEVYSELSTASAGEYKQARLTALLTVPEGPPPAVAGTYPTPGQDGVPLDQSIMIVFNQPMEQSSLEKAISVTMSASFNISTFSLEPFIVLLRPEKPLAAGIKYTITVSPEAVSTAGLALPEPYESSFTTAEAGPAPEIVSTVPEDGAVDDMAGQPVTIRFNGRMATDKVESAIAVSPAFDYSVIWSDGGTLAVLRPHAPLDANVLYTVTVGTGAMSANGVRLEDEYSFSFTTGIMNVPRVLGTMPLANQKDIPSHHPLQIVFDRSMDRESVEANLEVSPGFQYNTRWFEADMVLHLEPVTPLTPNVVYTVAIGPGVLSSFGLPLPDGYQFHFTTAAQ